MDFKATSTYNCYLQHYQKKHTSRKIKRVTTVLSTIPTSLLWLPQQMRGGRRFLSHELLVKKWKLWKSLNQLFVDCLLLVCLWLHSAFANFSWHSYLCLFYALQLFSRWLSGLKRTYAWARLFEGGLRVLCANLCWLGSTVCSLSPYCWAVANMSHVLRACRRISFTFAFAFACVRVVNSKHCFEF